MATFRLEGSELTWRALTQRTNPDLVLEAAIERLRPVAPSVVRDGRDLVIKEKVPNVDARASELERLVSGAPYSIEGQSVFLPYCCDRDPRVQYLEWGGALSSSTFRQSSSDEVVVDGEVKIFRQHYVLEIAKATNDPDVVALTGGAPIERSARFVGPVLLLVGRRSAPESLKQYVVFLDQADVIWFCNSQRIYCDAQQHEPWTRTALEAAALRNRRFSLLLVDRAAAEPRDRVAALPSNVRRTVGYKDDVLAVAAEGTEDELTVHADQLREHFSSPTLRVVDAIGQPGETPKALYTRVLGMLK